jgi:hypothetical protein
MRRALTAALEVIERALVVIVQVVRLVWNVIFGLFIFGVLAVVGMLILDGALWLVPILAVFGFALFVLLRNRYRRHRFSSPARG